MTIQNREGYIESLRRQKPKVFMAGERVENIADNAMFRGGINSIAVAYDAANDSKYKDLATANSTLTRQGISRWNHIIENEQDAIAKVKLLRTMGNYLVPCSYRCITADILNTAWVISYEIDKKYNTSYHRRVVDAIKDVQMKDSVVGGALVDPKGDRSLRPSKQVDPDMYLHIVERRGDGIVVRGAKAHSTAAPYTNMLFVMPVSRPLSEDEKDYAVGFFTPVDTEGITFICRPPAIPLELKELENPYSSRFAGHVEAMVIFDDVFIPWERVFMAGENEFTGPMMDAFASFHMMSKCGCRPASIDLAIGATGLIADYNGTERASHIRECLTDMIMTAEITYSCGLAAAVQGVRHDSGVYIPKGMPGYTGKVFAAKKLGEDRYFMQEVGGALVATMASEKDYRNPETGKYLEKYYQGREGVPTEHRMRAFRLIEDLTASPYAGWYHGMAITGGGTPQALRVGVLLDYEMEESKRRAKIAAGIE